MNPEVALNEAVLSSARGCGISWNPCIPEGNSREAGEVTRHYGLDPANGWAIWRSAFPWAEERIPQMETLSVILVQNPIALPGPHFHVTATSDSFAFIHPTSGISHTLTVQEFERRTMPHGHVDLPGETVPTHYAMMRYTLLPDLPDEACTVTDCDRSDPSRKTHPPANQAQAGNIVCVGIIGGARGPTAIMIGSSDKQDHGHVVCSAVHFEPVDKVEWRMVFYEKSHEDKTVELKGVESIKE